jgi:hypothetical protein
MIILQAVAVVFLLIWLLVVILVIVELRLLFSARKHSFTEARSVAKLLCLQSAVAICGAWCWLNGHEGILLSLTGFQVVLTIPAIVRCDSLAMRLQVL